MHVIQARRKREAGGSPNNLLKFVDFVSEKAVKAKVAGMKIQIRIYSRKIPESIKNAISLDVIQPGPSRRGGRGGKRSRARTPRGPVNVLCHTILLLLYISSVHFYGN